MTGVSSSSRALEFRVQSFRLLSFSGGSGCKVGGLGFLVSFGFRNSGAGFKVQVSGVAMNVSGLRDARFLWA